MGNRSLFPSPLPVRLLGTIGVVTVLMISGHAAAQAASSKLLSGKDLTEANVLEALTPGAMPAGDKGILTRSLKVSAEPSPPGTAKSQAPREKPSASLLITFVTNSAALTPHSKEQLVVVAAALKNDRLKDYKFEVEGHADPRGVPAANLVLSVQRAESVRGYLVSVQNVEPSRLSAVGKGDTEPMNTKNVAAPENRRVTITTQTP